MAGAVAGQPIPVDHGRPVPGAGSQPRTGGRRQCAPAASGALEPRKQLPAQDRPPPDPRLPAARRPRVPGGALPRVSRGAGHARSVHKGQVSQVVCRSVSVLPY